jgi:flagellar motor switch protein FliM
MTDQQFLSQDEVDSLLTGVNGESDDAATAKPVEGVRPYNLATQERIVRERMPALDVINDRFARTLKSGLFDFMRRVPEISVGPVRVIRYDEFAKSLVEPTNLNVAQLKPLRGNALFVFEPSLIFLVVDNLFGGDGRFQTRSDGREFTTTESRIIRGMLQVVFDGYQKSWASVYPLQFDYVRSETHMQFATIAAPNEIVIVSSFTIELGSGGGACHICVPYATVEPIRDLIYGTSTAEAPQPDRRWTQLLAQHVQQADVEIVATLASASVKLGTLLASRVGDVLPIDVAPVVRAEVDGVPLLECRYGVANGHYALQVERMIAPPPEPQGGNHA